MAKIYIMLEFKKFLFFLYIYFSCLVSPFAWKHCSHCPSELQSSIERGFTMTHLLKEMESFQVENKFQVPSWLGRVSSIPRKFLNSMILPVQHHKKLPLKLTPQNCHISSMVTTWSRGLLILNTLFSALNKKWMVQGWKSGEGQCVSSWTPHETLQDLMPIPPASLTCSTGQTAQTLLP